MPLKLSRSKFNIKFQKKKNRRSFSIGTTRPNVDGINTNNTQPGFIPSYENLIGINPIEKQEFTQSTSI